MRSTKASIFSDSLERVNLFLPWLFIIGALLEIGFSYQVTSSEQKTLILIAALVFFNHTHVFLTPLMFLSFSEFRQWARERKTKTFSSKVFFISFFTLNALLIGLWKTSEQNDFAWIGLAAAALYATFSTYHNVFQTYGFLNLYAYVSSSAQKTQFNFTKIYKPLFYLLFVLVSVHFAISFHDSLNPSSKFIDNTALMGRLLTGIKLLITLSIITMASLETGSLLSHKSLYSMRLLLVAMNPVSVVALTGFLAIHGVEYLLLYHKMASKKRVLKSGPFLLFGLIVFMLAVSLPKLLLNGSLGLTVPFLVGITLKSMLLASDMTHYLMDSFIYRFSRKESRVNILPLILSTEPSQEAVSDEKDHGDYGRHKRAW